MVATGQISTETTEEERKKCVDDAANGPSVEDDADGADLIPWIEAEELLHQVDQPSSPSFTRESLERAAAPEAPASVVGRLAAFNRMLRTMLLMATAVGLAAWAKLPELDIMTDAKMWQACGQDFCVTMGLFSAPLAVIMLDILFGSFLANEFVLCIGSWGVLAAVAIHARQQQGPGATGRAGARFSSNDGLPFHIEHCA
jgi:hypothetical protein